MMQNSKKFCPPIMKLGRNKTAKKKIRRAASGNLKLA
jgi:hypothetical protein